MNLHLNRMAEIEDWLENNSVESWCAIDDLPMEGLGTRFVRTDERMGIAQTGIVDKLKFALNVNN